MGSEGSWRYKLVVVTRADLPLSKGKLAAQVAHAAVDCALEAQQEDPRTFEAWYGEGQRKVVCKAPTEEALQRLRTQARQAGLVTALIRDAGLTEVEPGTVTVLGIGPGTTSQLDAITGTLPLL